MYKKYFKRAIDFSVALLTLIFAAIPLLGVALMVKLSSPGPVLFKQERFGLDSKPFMVYKFRSMRVGTPMMANHDIADIRSYITPFGYFMRKTSIDELPQLLNVIKGDMSFVGPRPLAIVDKEVLDLRREMGADKVRPGITGWAQIHGRNAISDIKKASYDAEYARNVSLRMDFDILLQTIVKVLQSDGIFQ
ncbi:sugar transferase [Eupransor demetentiae]|uniref:Teichoic acid (WcaJ n=1 Tax=Eupransor demetentiae TaxID=3109584 RepID=A0ABM9N4J9_9LACO|nr:Sugar transferase involved in LPS biosynthesis (colanic [Lactobacillaceae bacterium LMG 33000]